MMNTGPRMSVSATPSSSRERCRVKPRHLGFQKIFFALAKLHNRLSLAKLDDNEMRML